MELAKDTTQSSCTQNVHDYKTYSEDLRHLEPLPDNILFGSCKKRNRILVEDL